MTDTQVDDIDLLYAWREGDMASFDTLYQRYRRPLFVFLMRRSHAQMEAEEIFHECWIRVINHDQDFTGTSFKAWLYTIARNLSTDMLRKVHPQSLEDDQRFAQDMSAVTTQRVQEGVDCIELIKRSVAALPLEQRDAFLLQHEGGLSLQQIADLTAVGRETIKSRLRYAMQHLRQMMAECL